TSGRSGSRSAHRASTTSRSCPGCCAASTSPTSSPSSPASTSSSDTSIDERLHRHPLAAPGGPPLMLAELSYWQQTVLRSVGVLAAVLLPAGTFVYLFLFKAISFMQSRLGPNEAGPYGSMQLLAEVGKWIQKE